MANAINAVIDGQGQLDYGLCWGPPTGDSISGLGLLTYGFVWLRNDIWVPGLLPIDPGWVPCDCCANCN